ETHHRAALRLPVFRALAIASLAGKWPVLVTEVRAAADAAGAEAARAASDSPTASAASLAADSAGAAAYAMFIDSAPGAAVQSAADAITAAPAFGGYSSAYSNAFARVTRADAADIWAAISTDAIALGNAVSFHALSATLLWPNEAAGDAPGAAARNSTPDWAARAWNTLKADLLAANEGWEVWTDWYDDRLEGRFGPQALELARATIPDEDWEKGPAHVNAIIRRQIEEHTPKPSPSPAPRAGPETLAEIDAAFNGPFLTLSITDFTFLDSRYTVVPFDTDALDDPAASPRHRDMVETLAWAAGELSRLAERNKLGPEDGRRCGTYAGLLEAAPLNARLLHMIARALLAEIQAAHSEDRLSPGDAQVAQDFRTAHVGLLEAFYPDVLTADRRADTVELPNEPSPEDVAEPLRELGGVLREAGDLVADDLRDAFDELDRIGQGQLRKAQLQEIAADDDASRLFRRFATRAVATVGRFYLFVKRHAVAIGKATGWTVATGGGLAAMEAQWGTVTWLLARLQPIWEKLLPFVPL
ncbi:MAG TPA: hypothetical protein VFJ13_10320, partial [Paracoccaceae bacterium]|nr:hypothetical protein [Paracoccaceae bacterium]